MPFFAVFGDAAVLGAALRLHKVLLRPRLDDDLGRGARLLQYLPQLEEADRERVRTRLLAVLRFLPLHRGMVSRRCLCGAAAGEGSGSKARRGLFLRACLARVAELEKVVLRVLQEGGRVALLERCLLYTSPSPRDATLSRMPSSA